MFSHLFPRFSSKIDHGLASRSFFSHGFLQKLNMTGLVSRRRLIILGERKGRFATGSPRQKKQRLKILTFFTVNYQMLRPDGYFFR